MKQYYWALVKKDKPNELIVEHLCPFVYKTRYFARLNKKVDEKVVKVTWSFVNEK